MNGIIILALLIVAFITGWYREKKHYERIIRQEEELKNIVAVDEYHVEQLHVSGGEMVMGNVVVSGDFFRNFIGNIMNAFGGRLTIFESLLDRARREALIRAKKDCLERGYTAIANVRYEMTILTEAQGQIPQVEIFVYGTGFVAKL